METEDRTTSDREKGKGKDKDFRGDDPPILVGGGGSTYVWIRKDITTTLVADPATIANHPKTPQKYHVFKCEVDCEKVDVDEGKGNPPSSHPVDKVKHLTGFGE